MSLRATDPIHFDIEEKFRLYGLFYERRKGEYRELKKPVDQIISIQSLAACCDGDTFAAAEQRICDAISCAEERLRKVFSDVHNRDMFVASMIQHRRVDKYLAGRGDLKDVVSIIRY